jgi:3-keto-5-aminohexanoate cleavage enzyme
MIPCDPVTLNWGSFDPTGAHADTIYRNTMSETAYVFGLCRALGAGCTLSIFEPGGLALAMAHHRNGTLPEGTIVKLEFSAGELVFGLPPTPKALAAYLEMMEGSGLPWMVTLRGGDLNGEFGRHVIAEGGHVRVGLEDFGGPRQPTNAQLVAEIAAIAEGLGRPVADRATARAIIGL